MVGFSCTMMVTWEAILMYLYCRLPDLSSFSLTKASVFLSGFEKSGKASPPRYLLLTDMMILSGGPAGLVYGFLLVWVGVLALFITLSELASM